MPFPDSTKKAPNVFFETFDDTGAPVSRSFVPAPGPQISDITPPPPPPIPPPVADFIGTPYTTGQRPLTVQFTDLSTNSPNAWSWDFGDGSPLGTAQNPTHVYSSIGTYTVTLTASNPGGSGSETKIAYIVVFNFSYQWSRKQIYFGGNLQIDGQVTERSLYSMRQVDVDVVGIFENPPVSVTDNEFIVDAVYNYKDDRVYILRNRILTDEWRLLRFDPRQMITEQSVVVTKNAGPSQMRLVATSFDDVWINEYYNDGLNQHNRLRRFNGPTLVSNFDANIVEFDNEGPTWQAACGTGKISAANLTGDGLIIIEILSPTTYSFTNIPLQISGDFSPNFRPTTDIQRCYNELTDEIWIPYNATLSNNPYVARVNATSQTVVYNISPTVYSTSNIWWNSFTNTMIMNADVNNGQAEACIESLSNNGGIMAIHGLNTTNNWIDFRPSGNFITCNDNYTGYGTAEFPSGIFITDTQPINLTVDYDDYYGSPNSHRKWSRFNRDWIYIPMRNEPFPEAFPTYTTTPPVATSLGLIFNNWNTGDLVTTTGITWYKITYDGTYTLRLNILPTIADPVVQADIIIYDSYARQIQIRNDSSLAQNENLPGDYYIAVVLTDRGPANSFTVGYDIFPTATALLSYSFQLEAKLR